MKKQDLIYKGANGKLAGYDLAIPDHFNGTLIYFIHGYKGYKNWGAWDLISDFFYDKGYGFAKCNLSHNGTSLSHPNAFTDLDAFAENTYSYELEDIKSFINTVNSQIQQPVQSRVLIGHSRGGGDVILSAENNINILVTWASISNIENRFLKGEALNKWKTEGVYSVLNGRTKQHMPHNYSFYQDYIQNSDRLNILKAAKKLTLPWAIIHGTKDTSVTISEGLELKNACKHSQFIEIKGANHVFGAKEPYHSSQLPEHTLDLVTQTLNFIKEQTKQ